MLLLGVIDTIIPPSNQILTNFQKIIVHAVYA